MSKLIRSYHDMAASSKPCSQFCILYILVPRITELWLENLDHKSLSKGTRMSVVFLDIVVDKDIEMFQKATFEEYQDVKMTATHFKAR